LGAVVVVVKLTLLVLMEVLEADHPTIQQPLALEQQVRETVEVVVVTPLEVLVVEEELAEQE
jgi:hypothetical protein